MLAARNPFLGMIELPIQGSTQVGLATFDQDASLAELFQRLEHGAERSVIAHSTRAELAHSLRQIEGLQGDNDFALADLVGLEVDLAKELSRLLSRLQSARATENP